jgi:hypothetical protein
MNRLPAAAFAVLVLIASLSTVARASTMTSCQNGNTSNPTLSVCTYAAGVGYTQDSDSSARAAYGALGVSGNLDIASPNIGVAATYNAIASFTDTFTVTTATPTTGFLDFTDLVDGSSNVTGSGTFFPLINGETLFDETTLGVYSVIDPINAIGADYYIPVGNGTTLDTISLPFISSESETFTITFQTNGGCGIAGASACVVDSNYFNTSIITGYSLTGASGSPISGTVNFASGTNYDAIPRDASAATPEPSSLLLLATGLAGVGWFARRRLGRG